MTTYRCTEFTAHDAAALTGKSVDVTAVTDDETGATETHKDAFVLGVFGPVMGLMVGTQVEPNVVEHRPHNVFLSDVREITVR